MSAELNLDLIQARAKFLAAEDRSMRRSLVKLRREAGLTQQDVADFMGCTQQAIQKLERYDADPKLSTLRRYSNAVGALVSHVVERDEGRSLGFANRTRVVTSAESRKTVGVTRASARINPPAYRAASKVTDFTLAA